MSPIINANAGWTYYLARQYDREMEELRKTLELGPHCGMAYLYMGFAYAQQRMYEEAIVASQKAIDLTGRMPWTAESLGYVYGLAGERDKAEQILRDSEAQLKQRSVPSSAFALIDVGLGEDEKGFALHKAYDERNALLLWLTVMPEFDLVRSDSRFQDLLRQMRL